MSISASDSWSAISDVAWSFGDGTSGSGSGVSHAYGTAGTYEVTVTLTDAVGNATTRTGTITVVAAPAPPALVPPTAAPPAITSFRLRPARIRAIGSDSSAKRKTKAAIVLTAADEKSTSFGCSNEREWTYFGDALFNHGLRPEVSLEEAFRAARETIAQWEARDGLQPSNPQAHFGPALTARLATVYGASRRAERSPVP